MNPDHKLRWYVVRATVEAQSIKSVIILTVIDYFFLHCFKVEGNSFLRKCLTICGTCKFLHFMYIFFYHWSNRKYFLQ